MKRLIKPNWKKCNLNISATLAEFLGAPNSNSTLPVLKKELAKGYKNVVFICLDGFGIDPIVKNLDKKDLLRKNIKQTLTSTFPSATTCATTSLTANLKPLEHGWLAGSVYFEDIKRSIDLYPHTDSLTGEKLDYIYPLYDNEICYFDNVNTDYNITPIVPACVATKSEDKKIIIKNEFDMCKTIKKVCQKGGKQFIYSYLTEPDSTMHNFGVASAEAKSKIYSINKEIEKLYNDLEDTLIIITADHGHIDVKGHIEFYKDEELNNMLECTPFLEARAPAFIVKEGREQEFENKFTKKYGNDFKLFKSQKLIDKGYFGNKGQYGYLLGDYIAIGTYTHKQFLAHKGYQRYKGHHSSLTEEMKVPLIILKKEKE